MNADKNYIKTTIPFQSFNLSNSLFQTTNEKERGVGIELELFRAVGFFRSDFFRLFPLAVAMSGHGRTARAPTKSTMQRFLINRKFTDLKENIREEEDIIDYT